MNLLNKASSIFASETLWAFAYLGYEERFFYQGRYKVSLFDRIKSNHGRCAPQPKISFYPPNLISESKS